MLLALYNLIVLKAQHSERRKKRVAILLTAARINAEKTQQEAAKYVGKSVVTIQNYEAYASTPDIATAKKLAEFYGCTVDDIIWDR